MITRVTDNRLFVVPGMETYFATYPVVIYNSTKNLLDKLLRPTTTCLPNLVVIDLSRSTDTGLNFMRELKSYNRLRSIPVLVRRVSAEATKGVVIPVRKWEELTMPHFAWEQPLLIAA
ncbi:hypothetical protein GCM10027299_29470 [Larkinella ripae]